MGIVVTVAMLLGVLFMLPLSVLRPVQYSMKAALIVAALLFVLGVWNSLYGISHWQAFWGVSALVSGVFMMLAGIVIYRDRDKTTRLPAWLALVKAMIIIALLLCFGLYSITLIQLNLGYPIIH